MISNVLLLLFLSSSSSSSWQRWRIRLNPVVSKIMLF